jgi:HAMP domain-containing protein
MLDRKITIKPYRGGSLGLRIFLISLVLLVVPLFFHTFVLYQREYRQTLQDVQAMLRVIGEGQRALLEDKMKGQQDILDAALWDCLVLEKGFQILEIPACEDRSGSFATLSDDRENLWVGRGVGTETTLAIATPLAEIFHELTHFEDALYPIAVAFVDEKGEILAGEMLEGSLRLQMPLEGADFSFVLTADEHSVRDLHFRAYLFRFLSFFAFVGILGGSIVWLLMRRFSRPLKSLCGVMQKVGEGASHVRYKQDWMGFEINQLGERFNQMLESMQAQREEVEKQRLARERLAEELRIGKKIQLSLLPSLPEFPEMDVGARFLPAREVGGDFYDLFLLPDGSIFIAMADTAGKGVSACLYSLGLRSMLRSLSLLGSDLSEIVLHANDLFLHDARQSGVFVTLWAGIYDPAQRQLTYCSQGHPPAILLRGKKLEELWTAGISLGAQSFDVVPVKKMKLLPDDLLFLNF